MLKCIGLNNVRPIRVNKRNWPFAKFTYQEVVVLLLGGDSAHRFSLKSVTRFSLL